MTKRAKTHCKRTRKGRGFELKVCGRNLCPQVKRSIEGAARLLALNIMGAKICNTITIKVTVVANDKYLGCLYTDCINGTRDLRSFPVTVTSGRGMVDMIRTLAHELRHVEQFRRGRLQYRLWSTDRKVHARWEGVELGPCDNLPYYTRPWEVEARAESVSPSTEEVILKVLNMG